MDVHAAGGILVGSAGSVASTVATDITITTADAEIDRQDAIVVDDTGTVTAIDGPVNDGVNAQPPDTTGYTELAFVYVVSQAHPDYTGTITDEWIADRRVLVDGLTSAATTGASDSSRYVGATTSGAPATGTFMKGDFSVDQTGSFWICTTAGTPGTWTHIT